MTRSSLAIPGTLVTLGGTFLALGLSITAETTPAPRTQTPPARPAMAVAHKTPTPPADAPPDVVKQYCVGCHSDKGRAGGLSLASFDAAHADQNADVAE